MTKKLEIPPVIAAIAPDGKLLPAQRRKILIDISLRRQKPGTGSALEFLRRRTAMNPWPDLRPILKGIRWVVVGAVATRAFMPERMTKDLDILISKNDAEEVLKRLQAQGYKVISQLAIPGMLLRSPEGIQVDVIFGDYPWLEDALESPIQDAAEFPVLDLPYLVLMKMESSRGRDIGDLNTMLGLASEEMLNRVRAVVKRYSPESMDDLESLVFLGRLEMSDGSQKT
ncbi:MAG: hypothetical protein HY070_01130 [Chloroflexi bacterium]|nr:hypothetical protein [Chloroflexota bacterium]